MGLEQKDQSDNQKGLVSMEPENISADKLTAAYLTMQQINRINFLVSIGLANLEGSKTEQIALAVSFALRSLEILLGKENLDKDYKKKCIEYKKKVFVPIGARAVHEDLSQLSRHAFLFETAPTYALIYCMEWYDLLIEQAQKSNLYPTKQKTDFEM